MSETNDSQSNDVSIFSYFKSTIITSFYLSKILQKIFIKTKLKKNKQTKLYV